MSRRLAQIEKGKKVKFHQSKQRIPQVAKEMSVWYIEPRETTQYYLSFEKMHSRLAVSYLEGFAL